MVTINFYLIENAEKAAEKNGKKHNHKRNKKTVVYEVGDSVSVKIPSIDNGGSELRRIPCLITDLGHEKYRLMCPYGILSELYSSAELEVYNGLIDFEYDKITNKISLTGAVVAASSGKRSTTIKQIEIECDCKGKCNTRRCGCKAANQKCNSHCHAKTSHLNCCENK